jgi:hypothetical protein
MYLEYPLLNDVSLYKILFVLLETQLDLTNTFKSTHLEVVWYLNKLLKQHEKWSKFATFKCF